ncbi:hypothetical protein AF953_00874 [Listeria monocytogenes]|nr:hypothetical protein AF959_00537 [Listeria monocytogenes]RKC33780.1 hypothetical protein AF953_00874 [Listeria monocytogenes]RKC78185.1 hypothetical protein AF956_00746 [Listeria monocytogenes]RLQ36455.1 hypothetical protein AF960_02853 [Listeria monocytogenes]
MAKDKWEPTKYLDIYEYMTKKASVIGYEFVISKVVGILK